MSENCLPLFFGMGTQSILDNKAICLNLNIGSQTKKRTVWSELTFSILQITSLQLQIKIINRFLCAICQELL